MRQFLIAVIVFMASATTVALHCRGQSTVINGADCMSNASCGTCLVYENSGVCYSTSCTGGTPGLFKSCVYGGNSLCPQTGTTSWFCSGCTDYPNGPPVSGICAPANCGSIPGIPCGGWATWADCT